MALSAPVPACGPGSKVDEDEQCPFIKPSESTDLGGTAKVMTCGIKIQDLSWLE